MDLKVAVLQHTLDLFDPIRLNNEREQDLQPQGSLQRKLSLQQGCCLYTLLKLCSILFLR